MDEHNVMCVCAYIFSLKKECDSDTNYNMNELWGYYTKWNKPITEGQIYDSTHMRHIE